MFKERVSKLLQATSAEAVYITSAENLMYYSGFTGGEGALVLKRDTLVLFTDSRYLVQAKEESPDFEIVDVARLRAETFLEEKCPMSLEFEENHLTASAYDKLQKLLPGCEFCPLDETILLQRAVKDAREIELTRKAEHLAVCAFNHVLPQIRPGVKERDIALELEWYMRKNGASAPSFPIICASGVRSAMPHGVASDKTLEAGDFVTMDFGCFLNGYASDMTRTVVLGRATEEQKKIYQTVLSAQRAAVSAVKAGVKGSEIDTVARNIIAEAGYGDYFGHALGHGTGLEIHEKPVLSPRSASVLEPGMLVTVEPGIYIEGFGGVRIEDLLLVTENGYENLTDSPKELLEL